MTARPDRWWQALRRDASVSAVVAGFVAVLVGYTSSVAIVFQAAAAVGADTAQTASWMWALGIGMGVTSLGLTLWYRLPVLTAWSTPGAALIATGGAGLTLPEATGAFMVSALLVVVAGATGLFARLMGRLPQALAAALLAGVLTRFAFEAFGSLRVEPVLVGVMFAAYLAGRRWWPRHAVPVLLVVAIVVAAIQGSLHLETIRWAWVVPQAVWPAFTWAAAAGLALPLFVVTMASQNLPGVAAQRAAGYATPVSPVVATTGLATLLLAPFGGYAFNLAAITAAVCMSPEAHEDPSRRWVAAAAAGVFYLGLGVAGAAAVGLIAAFPKALVLALSGFALLGTIGSSLVTAVRDERTREAALVTFLVTASGVVLAGIASAFWGLVLGALTLVVQHFGRRASTPRTPP